MYLNGCSKEQFMIWKYYALINTLRLTIWYFILVLQRYCKLMLTRSGTLPCFLLQFSDHIHSIFTGTTGSTGSTDMGSTGMGSTGMGTGVTNNNHNNNNNNNNNNNSNNTLQYTNAIRRNQIDSFMKFLEYMKNMMGGFGIIWFIVGIIYYLMEPL